MTRYEQGFMNKCAEYGLDADTSMQLMKEAGAFGKLLGKGVNRLGRLFHGNGVGPNLVERIGSQLQDRGFRGTVADAGKRYWKNLSGRGVREAEGNVNRANSARWDASNSMTDAYNHAMYVDPSPASTKAYKDAINAYTDATMGVARSEEALAKALRSRHSTRLATGAVMAPFLPLVAQRKQNKAESKGRS